jgi:hypothetical protein
LIGTIQNSSVNSEDWDDFVAGNGGLIYHTWDWISILSESYSRMRNISTALLTDGKISGIFPMISLSAYGLTYSLSLPSSTGGPIFQNPDQLNDALKYFLKRCNVVEIHSYSRFEIAGESSVPHLVIPLIENVQKVRRGYEKNVRTSLKKAERIGVSVRASEAESDIHEFYEIYKETVLTQAGPSKISFAHIRNVIKKLTREKCLFLVAEIDQKVIGGLVGLFNQNNAFYWAAASKRGYNASDLLLDSLIEYSSNRSDKLFLGGGRFGLKDNLYFFKSRWGGKEVPAYRYHLVSGVRGKALTALTGLASRFPQIKEKIFESE